MIFPNSIEDLKRLINSGTPIINSGNNNIIVIKNRKKKYVLKKYFNETLRLKREIYFLNYCKLINYKNCPKIIYYSEKLNYSILNYIDGEPLSNSKKTNKNLIEAYQAFINSINCNSSFDYKMTAKESAFSIKQHLSIIKSRLDLYLGLSKKISNDCFEILSLLNFQFNLLVKKNHKELRNLSNMINPIISPSDVGFHNTLFNDKEYFFVDFEYSGLDDPAKMICDFFLQPRFEFNLNDSESFTNNLIFSNDIIKNRVRI